MIISIVLQCYNVEKHIWCVISKLPTEIKYIIAVDDQSSDGTAEVLQQLSQHDSRIIYIGHERNQGVGGAMLTGFRKSIELQCDITIKMDGDDQMDSSYLSELLQPLLQDKADYTKGNRFRDFQALKNMPLGRRFGNLGLSFLIKAASGYWNIFDPTNGFIAIKNETLKRINLKKIHKRYFFESSMLIELYYANAVIYEVPMKARYGEEVSGLSKVKTLFEFPPKLIAAFFRRIILKYFLFDFNIGSIYILFGFILFMSGLLYGILNFIKYQKEGIGAPTGTVVIPTLLITLGFQLLLSAVSYDIGNYPKKNGQ
jgi:glycosyltransferase involved in cell wall biosynthesis